MSLKSWEKRGRREVTRLLGRWLGPSRGAGELPDLSGLRSILLVRQHNQLGDMLLSTAALRAVRKRAPEARIDLIAGPQNHDAVRGNRHLDHVLLYDKASYLRNPVAAKRFVRRLRRAGYDLALVMSTVSFSYTSAWLAALSGARRRAGRPGPGGLGAETARDLFHWVLPEPVPGRHQTGVCLDLVAPFGAADTDWAPEIFLSPEEERAGEAALGDAVGGSGSLRVVVHPGAGKLPNRWPAERFGKVAAALRAEGHRVAAVSGPGETGLLAAVDRGAGEAVPRLAPLGFRELGGALHHADLLIANDTGVLHLGAAVGVPALALFGPTDPAQWCPAFAGIRVLRAGDGNLGRLPVSVVREAAVGYAAHLAGAGEMPAVLGGAPGFSS